MNNLRFVFSGRRFRCAQNDLCMVHCIQTEKVMAKPFVPHALPLENLDWKQLSPLIGSANAALARYDGLLQTMLNPAILLSPMTTREAVLSSMIEGTQASMEEVLQYEAGEKFDQAKTNDIQEVQNYRNALQNGEEALLHGRRLSLSLIKGLHQILMQGVRGQDKNPGEFRKTQNWIGPYQRPIEEATFIPPDPLIVPEYLDKWERYIFSVEGDVLSQLAIVHAQFEIIHPFKDGNGRIGRMLIPLFLYQRRILHRPMFYLSEILEEHRDEYCRRLAAISITNDWQNWILFFLKAIEEQARRNFDKAKKIFDLYGSMKKEIQSLTKSQFALPVLDVLFAHPIFSSTEFMHRAGIKNRTTALTILNHLQQAGIIKTWRKSAGSSSAIHAFPNILNIAEGRAIF